MNKSPVEKEYELWLFRYHQAAKQKNIEGLKFISLKLNELRDKVKENSTKQK